MSSLHPFSRHCHLSEDNDLEHRPAACLTTMTAKHYQPNVSTHGPPPPEWATWHCLRNQEIMKNAYKISASNDPASFFHHFRVCGEVASTYSPSSITPITVTSKSPKTTHAPALIPGPFCMLESQTPCQQTRRDEAMTESIRRSKWEEDDER